jgi:hypothetical protein
MTGGGLGFSDDHIITLPHDHIILPPAPVAIREASSGRKYGPAYACPGGLYPDRYINENVYIYEYIYT